MAHRQNSILGTPDHLFARFDVEARVGLRECPDGGIVLDASRVSLGDHDIAVVLIADLAGIPGGRNRGRSATNALPAIIDCYRDVVMLTFLTPDIVWIQSDSLGAFDFVLSTESDPAADWRPVLSGAHAGRTEQDFVALYGSYATRAMTNVRRAVAGVTR